MSSAAIFCFFETAAQAGSLGSELGIRCHQIAVHRFPDGESLVRADRSPPVALLYRSLDDPNAKLVELLLAASALRENGAARVILIAPYLAYMRQDKAFHPGEAVSQRVIGGLLAERFDALLTIDPHLHRTSSLDAVMPGIEAIAISAAPAIAAALDRSGDPLLVGPDGESRRWVEKIAAPLGLDLLIGEKQRGGDGAVTIDFPDLDRAAGRRVVLVDDVISSGETMAFAARLLRAAGATEIEAMATHCLATEAGLECMHAAGISRVRSTETVPGPTSSIPVAPLMATEIRSRRWLSVR